MEDGARRGKAYRARTGWVNVLDGAPFGYRYISTSDHAGASYEIIGHEAALVAEMFRRLRRAAGPAWRTSPAGFLA